MAGGGVIVPGLFCCIHSRLSLRLLALAAFQNPIKIVLGYPARRYIFIIRYFLVVAYKIFGAVSHLVWSRGSHIFTSVGIKW